MSDDRPSDRILRIWSEVSARSRPAAQPGILSSVVRARPSHLSPIGFGALVAMVAAVAVVLLAGPGRQNPATTSPLSSATSPAADLTTPSALSSHGTAQASRRPDGSLMAGRLITATEGWALSGDELLVTRDGGQSWQASGYPGPAGDRLFGATFSDPNHGWIVREKVPTDASKTPLEVIIDRTDDGGATWESVSLPPIRGSEHEAIIASPTFSMVDAQVGYLLLAIDPTPRQILYVTADGGRTWNERPTAPPGHGWIWFVDAAHGWMAGGPTEATLFTTTDGGMTWEKQHLPVQPGFATSELVLTSGPSRTSTGQLILFAPFARDGYGGVFFRSGDDGATWSFAARTPSSAGSVAAVLDDRNWLVASGSTLRSTNDAGATWVSRNVGLPGPIGRLDVVDPAHLSAIVEETACGAGADCAVPFGLYVSSDSGMTWQDATP